MATDSVEFMRLSLEVNSVAFSSDGQLMAAGCAAGDVALYDTSVTTAAAATAAVRVVKVLKGHSKNVTTLAFSAGCSAAAGSPFLLASGSDDRTAQLWDCSQQGDHECVGVLNHDSAVFCVAFSPDGSLLASACEDHTARLWHVADRSAGLVLRGHTHQATSVAFSPNGSLLASGSDDHTVRLWHLPDGTPGLVLQGHKSNVWCVAFSPFASSNLLASCSSDDPSVGCEQQPGGASAGRTCRLCIQCGLFA